MLRKTDNCDRPKCNKRQKDDVTIFNLAITKGFESQSEVMSRTKKHTISKKLQTGVQIFNRLFLKLHSNHLGFPLTHNFEIILPFTS